MLFTPIFLMGSLFCVCLASPAVDAHAMHADGPCCDHDATGSKTPASPGHNPDCSHCGQVHWAKPDGVDLPGIYLASASHPPIPVRDLTVSFVALSYGPSPIVSDRLTGHPPSSILRHKCVLVI